MKTSIKFISLIFMTGILALSCKKNADNAPDMSIYDMDTTSTIKVDSINSTTDTTNVNSGTTGTTEKGNNSNTNKDSTTTKR